MPLGARLMNVFAAPGEVFDSVARSPFSIANWLVPALIAGVLGLVSVQVVFSNPALVDEIRQMQEQGFQQAIADGRITAEQAEQARQMMGDIGMTLGRVFGSIGAIVAGIVAPLWWGLIGWVVGRLILGGPVGFMRAVEVAGLSSLISALGGVVALFIALGTGRLWAVPHLGVFVENFDPTNRFHIGLVAFNVFGLWQLAIVSLGISRLSQRSYVGVLGLMFLFWVFYKGIAVALRAIQFAM